MNSPDPTYRPCQGCDRPPAIRSRPAPKLCPDERGRGRYVGARGQEACQLVDIDPVRPATPRSRGWLKCLSVQLACRVGVGARVLRLAITAPVGAGEAAIRTRSPAADAIIHSEQGVQYGSWACTKRAKDSGLVPSMDSIVDCYNAMMDAFRSRMQVELPDRTASGHVSSWPT
jgi:hypothetical protein